MSLGFYVLFIEIGHLGGAFEILSHIYGVERTLIITKLTNLAILLTGCFNELKSPRIGFNPVVMLQIK